MQHRSAGRKDDLPVQPALAAAASRAYEEKRTGNSFSYSCKGPAETNNITRILLPAEPKTVTVDGTDCDYDCDPDSRTVYLRFPNSPEGVHVAFTW